MKRIHSFSNGNPESEQWAKVEENEDGEFHIIDGWNMGQITAAILFPNLNTTRTYMAGRWNIPVSDIQFVGVEEVKPALTLDEKIVKLAQQLARGMILVGEFMDQMDRITQEAWEQEFNKGKQN